MPNYDFYCDACEQTFERHVPLALYDEVKNGLPCPQCGMYAQKAASAPGFALKGPGFHVNDYRTRKVG